MACELSSPQIKTAIGGAMGALLRAYLQVTLAQNGIAHTQAVPGMLARHASRTPG